MTIDLNAATEDEILDAYEITPTSLVAALTTLQDCLALGIFQDDEEGGGIFARGAEQAIAVLEAAGENGKEGAFRLVVDLHRQAKEEGRTVTPLALAGALAQIGLTLTVRDADAGNADAEAALRKQGLR